MYLIRRGRHQEALAVLEGAPDLNGNAQLERGRLYEQLGRHREAWRDWVAGKAKLAAQAGAVEYQAGAVEAFFARMKQFFVRENFELLPRATQRRDVPQPVFVMGLPRSGTTLIEQVLSSHSAVRPGGELTFVGEWPQLIGRLLSDPAPFPEKLAQMCSADYHHVAILLRDYYFARAEARGLLEPGKLLFTDKMPFNELWLPLVRMAFPRAKIVRIVRHPLDVCVSMLSHELTHGFNCGYRIETIVHQLCAMSGLTEHYRRELDSGEFLLRYEDFVREPEREISSSARIPRAAVRAGLSRLSRTTPLRGDAELRAGRREDQRPLDRSLSSPLGASRAFRITARALACRMGLRRRTDATNVSANLALTRRHTRSGANSI